MRYIVRFCVLVVLCGRECGVVSGGLPAILDLLVVLLGFARLG